MHTREGAGSVFSDAMMEVVVTLDRESTDIKLNNFEDLRIPNPTSGFLLIEIKKLQKTIDLISTK